MRNKKRFKTFAVAIAFLLLAAVETALASHSSTGSNTPSTVGASSHNSFTLTVDNDAGSSDSIYRVELSVHSDFTNIDASAPASWTYSIQDNTITWQTSVESAKIAPGGSEDFGWEATAPAASGDYSMWVETSDDAGGPGSTDWIQVTVTVPEFPLGLTMPFAVCLLMYIVIKKLH